MADPFIAEIRMFAGNFAPSGWAFCNGQIIPISQNTALFSLLGTTFGGNGQTTFALPNLQGRVPMHPGTGPGLTPRSLGDSGGSNSVTLTESQLPAHAHPPENAHASSATTGTPSETVSLAVTTARIYGPAVDLEPMNASAGGGQPHENRQPFLGLGFIIALQGIYPSRS
jgi:microcystin-dependent protein